MYIGNSTSTIDNNVENNTTYYYSALSYDEVYNYSDVSRKEANIPPNGFQAQPLPMSIV